MPAVKHTLAPDLVRSSGPLAQLCREHAVSRLEAFGSATDGRFIAGRSDYDFIARFEALPGVSRGRQFLAFSEALEALLGRPVDVMSDHAIHNPYLRRAIEASRVTVYERSAAEAPA